MAISERASQLARLGEDMAVRHVETLGWQVLERNWRCRAGELDIIAHDPEADVLVFVEVKCRSSERYGHPLEAITPAKEARLWLLALAWLKERELRCKRIRVDAIGIIVPKRGAEELVHARGIGG